MINYIYSSIIKLCECKKINHKTQDYNNNIYELNEYIDKYNNINLNNLNNMYYEECT